jgi:hypothetical protein
MLKYRRRGEDGRLGSGKIRLQPKNPALYILHICASTAATYRPRPACFPLNVAVVLLAYNVSTGCTGIALYARDRYNRLADMAKTWEFLYLIIFVYDNNNI